MSASPLRVTFISLTKLRGLEWTENGDGSGLLTIRTEAGETSWAVAGDPGRLERYRGCLQGLGASRLR